jgi:outer membrane biosynthesis protein TonB
MNIWRQFAASVLILSLLLSVACKKKKPQLPPQAQAPTIAVPIPDEISEAAPPPPPPPQQETPTPEPQKPKSPPRHRKKPAQPPASSPDTTPTNSTVAAAHPPPNPAEGAPDTAIAADVSSQQVSQQKQTTAELLAAAGKNLDESEKRKLSHDERAMVAQIKTYIAQSKKATSDNDFERAYNLATKARLLSDALVKK